MLEKPSLAASPAEAKAAPAQGSSVTALAQPGQLRAQNIQHRTISDAQSNPGHSLMPTGPGGSIAILVECQLQADLVKEIQTGPFATGQYNSLHSARPRKVAALVSCGVVYLPTPGPEPGA